MNVKKYLKRLEDLRFLRSERGPDGTVYHLHPALRDSVLANLGGTRASLAGAARDVMDKRVELVAGRPGTPPPTTTSALDYLEDLIGFCLDAGESSRALDLYWQRMGNYQHLGKVLADYARGERVSRRLVQDSLASSSLEAYQREVVLNDMGLFLKDTGRLSEALAVFSDLSSQGERDLPEQSTRYENLAEVQLLLGLLPAAERSVALAQRAAAQTGDEFKEKCELASWLATIVGARGQLRKALALFDQSRHFQNRELRRRHGVKTNPEQLLDLRGFHCQWLLLCTEQLAGRALELARGTLALYVRARLEPSTARSRLIEAEALRQLGQTREAEVSLRLAREWALDVANHELLLRADLVAAKLLLDKGDRHACRTKAEEGGRAAESSGCALYGIDFANVVAASCLEADIGLATEVAAKAGEDAEKRDYFWGQLAAQRTLRAAYMRRGDTGAKRMHAMRLSELEKRTRVHGDMIVP
jgi:hypothetical protein